MFNPFKKKKPQQEEPPQQMECPKCGGIMTLTNSDRSFFIFLEVTSDGRILEAGLWQRRGC